MLKIIVISLGSSLLASAASIAGTIQAISSSAVVTDNCRVYGYRYCNRVGNVDWPDAGDPKARAELTRFVRQISRDKL